MNNELNQLDIQEILQLLPHRYPFLLVDRVVHDEILKPEVLTKPRLMVAKAA